MSTLKKIVIEPKGLQINITTNGFMGIESQDWLIDRLKPKMVVVPI
jgi:hypothetical protein